MSSISLRQTVQERSETLHPELTKTTAPVERGDREWYRDAIIYQLHIKAFSDSNGDGIGDFAGLLERLDYVQALGVTAIWLLPFYPSPLRDDGYDIADYTAVHPAYGNLDGATPRSTTKARALSSSIPRRPIGLGTRRRTPTSGIVSIRTSPT